MKEYETPILKEEKVEIEDVIAASNPFAVNDFKDKLAGWGPGSKDKIK